MNKTKAKPSTGEGWAVHFYDKDRHLRFTLEPSHTWAFGWGIVMGLLVAVMWSAIYSASHSSLNQTQHSTNPSPTPETNSREGLRADPVSSFPLGID